MQQAGQGALAGPGTANHADQLAGADVQTDAAQDFRAVRSVAEVHLVELDLPLERRQGATRGLGQFGTSIEDVAQALHRDAGLLEVGPQLGQAHDRLGDTAGKHVEGDQLAYRKVAVDHQTRAQPQGGDGHQLADEADALVGEGGEGLGLEAGRHVTSQLVVPLTADLWLHRHRLEGVDAVDRLDQEGLVLRAAVEALLQAGAQQRRDEQGDEKVQR
ncbi:hypothetical protein D3C78_436570 [compost metagenome]